VAPRLTTIVTSIPVAPRLTTIVTSLASQHYLLAFVRFLWLSKYENIQSVNRVVSNVIDQWRQTVDNTSNSGYGASNRTLDQPINLSETKVFLLVSYVALCDRIYRHLYVYKFKTAQHAYV